MENRGSKEETLYYMIEGWHGEIADTDAYFHAAYRQEHPVQKGHAYTVIDGIEGKGIFAGISFAAGMNGHNTCWVEGEPKMYLDGDQYPTINYTGTEDYFCGSYAFGNDILLHKYQTFSGLYAGMYAILGNDSQEMYNGQHLDSDENINVYKYTLDEITDMIVKGEIHDAKTIGMTFLVKENKRRGMI